MASTSRPFAGSGEFRTRVKRIRLVRRWDQAFLAERAQISTGTLSSIETGKSIPTDEHVESLARALGYERRFLTSELNLLPTTRPWLRAYADASKREADARSALATLAAEYIRSLGLKPLPDLLPPLDIDRDDEEQIEEAAAEVRTLAGIDPDAVISNAVRAAERLGCVVLPLESELGRHLGMSVRADGIPILCVAKSGIPGDRQRFTVAHELGHLALHAGCPPPRDTAEASAMEKEANRFAAAFLGPGDALIDTLDEVGNGRVTLRNLTEVKSVWGISIKGLVGRYKSLGLIDSDHAQSLYKQISARKWTKVEPVTVRTESAQWFRRSIEMTAGVTDVASACLICAERVGGNNSDLRSFVDWEANDAEIVSIASRRRQAR